LDHDRVDAPRKRGNQYFYLRHSGLQPQPALWVRDGVDGDERVLIDPNAWSEDGATALAEWAASEDGALVAYAVQDGGTDWRTIRVLDVASGDVLADEVAWARFTNLAWARDGSGFFYARFPEPEPGASAQAVIANHAVWFHALGTPQAEDRLLYATPGQPVLTHAFEVTDDGRYAVVMSTPVSATNTLAVVDLESSDWRPRMLVENLDDEWSVVGNTGTAFYVITSKDAERRKVVTVNLAGADPVFEDLVGEQADVLTGGALVGGRLVLTYLDDVKTQLRRYTLDGEADGIVELPGIGSAGGVLGKPDDDEAFFVFTSYNAPTTIYRYDVATAARAVWAEPEIPIDLDRIVVEQRFFPSKDGTEIPSSSSAGRTSRSRPRPCSTATAASASA
jgi:prolyl oligopeptidase